jgi:hypothetical protein
MAREYSQNFWIAVAVVNFTQLFNLRRRKLKKNYLDYSGSWKESYKALKISQMLTFLTDSREKAAPVFQTQISLVLN